MLKHTHKTPTKNSKLKKKKKPFAGAAIGQVVYGVIYANARPEVPPWLPPRYAALVRACWSAEVGDRPTFAGILGELGEMLREALAAGAEAAAQAAAGVVAAAVAAAAEEEPPPSSQQQLYPLQQHPESSLESGATSGRGAESAPA